ICWAAGAQSREEGTERAPAADVRVQLFGQHDGFNGCEAEVAEAARREIDRFWEVAVGDRLPHDFRESGEKLVGRAHHTASQKVVATTASFCRAVWTRTR